MDGSTFRTKIEPQEPVAEKAIVKSPAAVIESKVEPPFLDYHREKGRPYIADYFGLSDMWQEKTGGFESEVNTINSYIKDEIEQGRLENSTQAVKELLKGIEKQIGNKTDRVTIKIAQMAAFTEFLHKTKDIHSNANKYGGAR